MVHLMNQPECGTDSVPVRGSLTEPQKPPVRFPHQPADPCMSFRTHV